MIAGVNNMTRIRYKELNGLFASPEYLAVNRLVKVIINPATFAVNITNSEGQIIESFMNSTSLASSKKYAKQILIQMGVNFSPEVRPRFSSLELQKEEVMADLNGDQ
jgi:hypothetical protein